MTFSGEQPCYTLIHVSNDIEFPSEGQLKDKFEHGISLFFCVKIPFFQGILRQKSMLLKSSF